MKVFKFGGASIKDAASIRNVCEIIKEHGSRPLLVVISASGKTTNALEEVTNAYYQNDGQLAGKLERRLLALDQQAERLGLEKIAPHCYADRWDRQLARLDRPQGVLA